MTTSSTAGAPELRRFVPEIALRWDELAPGDRVYRVDGTLCFLDVSGFTALSERLAQHGRIGAEEVTDILNRVFGAMLGTAYEYGGSLMKFGGDALLLLFTGENHAERAVSAVVSMQATLRSVSGEPTSVGRSQLRASVGVHSGAIHLFDVGTSHRELVITGPAGTMTTAMEHVAAAGEIVVSSATRSLLPPDAVSGPKSGGWIVKWRKPRSEPIGTAVGTELADGAAEEWIPAALRAFLTAATAEAEHRLASVGFVRFCGVDPMIESVGADAVAASLHETVSAIQAAADAEEVTFLASDINEDGGKVILVSGAPSAYDDLEGRLLRAARRIVESPSAFDLHIGIDRGHVFAGEVGASYRSTYTVMGDTVNVAARLAATAPAQHIYATPNVLDNAHSVFATTPLAPLRLKGKSEETIAYAVGEEIGYRPAETRTELPFVGRTSSLRTVTTALDLVDERGPTAIAVVGDTGIGKSRLVAEALKRRPPSAVFTIRAEPYGSANPYRPFRDPFRSVLGIERDTNDAMAAALERRIRSLDAGLLSLLPLLGDVAHIDVDETPQTSAIEPRFRRERLADVVIEVLGHLLTATTVFVIEDAHWMDEATSHLLDRLARATSDHPWGMVVTGRPTGGAFLSDATTTLELGPLSAEDSEILVIAATEAAPLRPHDVAAVVARAGGNPLFLEETIRVIRDTGGSSALPDSLAAVVDTRIDALPPLARRILRYASVLGRSFRISSLQELLEDANISLDDATRRVLGGFLESDDDDRLRFRHAVARDAAYSGLSFRRRRELHLRAAEAARRGAGGNVEDVADLLAMHYSLGGDVEKTWHFARIAGTKAKDAYANVEAAASFERALAAAKRLDIDAEQRADVWADLGDVRGVIGMFDEALEAYRRATRLLGTDPLARADIHEKRALMRERAGSYSLALREVTMGDTQLDGITGVQADRVRTHLAVRRAFIRQAQERVQEAREMALSAIDLAKDAGDASAEGKACMIVHWAHLVLGMPGGEPFGERALEIFEAGDELESLATATNLLGAGAYYGGRWDEAVTYYRRGQEAYERSGNLYQSAQLESNIGEVLVDQRRFAEAEPILRNAARIQRSSGWIEGADYAEMYLGRLLGERGEPEEALEILARVRSDHLESGRRGSAAEAAVYLAECLTRYGRAEDALELLVEVEHDVDGFPMQQATLLRVRSEVCTALGRPEEALEEARKSLATAAEQGQEYERALALLTVDGLQRLLGYSPNQQARTEAETILQELGVDTRLASTT